MKDVNLPSPALALEILCNVFTCMNSRKSVDSIVMFS